MPLYKNNVWVLQSSIPNTYLAPAVSALVSDTANLLVTTITGKSPNIIASGFTSSLVVTQTGSPTIFVPAALNGLATISSSDSATWGAASQLIAGAYTSQYDGTGSIPLVYGLSISTQRGGTGNITTSQTGIHVASGQRATASSGTVTAVRGVNIARPTGTAGMTFTNIYGVYIENQTPAAGTVTNTAYGIYQAGTGDLNFFAGTVTVPDDAYDSGWNGDLTVPTKNALYDKIETLGGGETAAWQSAPTFFEGTGVSLGAVASGNAGGLLMADGTNNQYGYYNFRVPDGADGMGISKIEIIYENLAASALNIYGSFKTIHYGYSNGGTATSDTTNTLTTFASPSTSGQTGIITAPADSFNALPATMVKGDVVTVAFRRQGNDASDTYAQTLRVLGCMVTWV